MTYDLFLGVDPGKKGAWALLKADGTLLAVEPLPYLGDRINSHELQQALIRAYPSTAPRAFNGCGANIEYPMAVQGQSGGEKAFLNCGIIICIAELFGASIHLPRPHIWKGKMGLSKDKSASVRLAVDLWPAWREKFVGPRGGLLDGMAESCLIAEHLRRANLRIRTPEVRESSKFPMSVPVLAGPRFRDGEWME